MAAPKTTVWDLDPHTRAKHAILRRYLQAWTPILTQGGFPEILYVDGFAGPGRYSKGEDGSPVIALHAARHRAVPTGTTIRFVFIEQDKKRARFLEKIVNDLDRPPHFRIRVIGGEPFETAFGEILGPYKAGNVPLPPTFAFIDPFGWRGVPFSIVREIVGNRRGEVLVTFMYEEINRFLAHPKQKGNFDAFFGARDWREGVRLTGPRERNRFLHDLYLRRLREAANARYVRSFEMRNGKDVVDYYLFHATNHIQGLKRMKEAMWKVDESGEFGFSDATDPGQAVLFEKEPNFGLLRSQVLARFGGCEATVEEVENFVLTETAFRETHYKRRILKPLEGSDPPALEVVDPPPGRKPGTYAEKSLRLRFRSGLP